MQSQNKANGGVGRRTTRNQRVTSEFNTKSNLFLCWAEKIAFLNFVSSLPSCGIQIQASIQAKCFSFLRQQSRSLWSHPGWGNAIHTKFCKTWWLNICLNLYLPLGHIFFSYQAHFMCAWDLSQQLATALTLTISARSHLSLFLGVLQKLIWVMLSMFYVALLDLHPVPLRDWLSGCKSQCKWFLRNNFHNSTTPFMGREVY